MTVRIDASARRALKPMAIIAAIGAFQGLAWSQALVEGELPSLAPLIEHVSPAVVNISVSGSIEVRNPLAQDPFFGRFLPPEGRREIQSAGSGVIVDAQAGYILTNHHVIENAETITVTLVDRRSLEARVVGTDRNSDLAVLQIDPPDLAEIALGDSDTLRVGDYVVAIGNPFGLSHTVTSGIVSGLGRNNINKDNPDAYEDFIQTDASINPGNSGGALINLRGELIGINSAILSGGGGVGNIGIGFAIPVNMARNVMEQIIAYGAVRRGLLGVSILSVTPEIASEYGLTGVNGALVTSVAPGSGAEEAGLQIGDVIVSLDEHPVLDAGALRNAIGLLRPGAQVELGIMREGRSRTLTAVLGEAESVQTIEALATFDPVFEGAELADNDETRSDFNGVRGILVTRVEPESPAALRGLRTGDIITHINRQPVANVADGRRIVESARSIILQVQRGNRGVLILMR